MRLHFFHIPALHAGPAQEELNGFLGTHRVSQVERQLIVDGVASGRAMCVSTVEGAAATDGPAASVLKGRSVYYIGMLGTGELAIAADVGGKVSRPLCGSRPMTETQPGPTSIWRAEALQ